MKSRTKRYVAVATAATSLVAFAVVGPGVAPAGAAASNEVIWSASGPCGTTRTVQAPVGTRSVTIYAQGGRGGKGQGQAGGSGGVGGAAGWVRATFPSSSGKWYSATVGCDGENGRSTDSGPGQRTATGGAGWSNGGNGYAGFIILSTRGSTAGAGGGSTAVCNGTACSADTDATSALLVAGGGGGGGLSNCVGTTPGTGGAGGAAASTSDGSGVGPSGANGTKADGSGPGIGGANNSTAWPYRFGQNTASPGLYDGEGISVAGGAGGAGRLGGQRGANAGGACKGSAGGGGGSSWIKNTGTVTSTGTASTTSTAWIVFNLCGADTAPFGDAGVFVNQQYRDFKGRDANVLERVAAAIPIAECQTTADDYIAGFLPTSQTTVDAQLVRMYYAYFKRAPDQGGFEYWSDRITRLHARLDAVSQFFATSPEFIAMYGALDNGGFVDRVYQNVLGRAPDAGGRAFWVDQLNRRLRNRGAVMTGFAESIEFRTAMTPRVDGFRIWRAMIRTFPTTGQMDTVALPRLVTPSLPVSASVKVARLHSRYAARF